QLARVRTQVLQNDSVQGLRENVAKFSAQAKNNTKLMTAAAKYGLAYAYYRQNRFEQAEAALKEAQEAAIPMKTGIFFGSL
ncbi:hypothetical protein ABTJ99_21325, partial [Acinetobacter baumannii]